VISGFRVCPGGMQHILGIRPDLTCLAKVTAGGLPGGALVGRKQVLDILARRRGDGTPNAQRVLHQGTFTGNPVTAAAALATINLIVARDACTHASVIAEYLRQRVNNLFTEKGLSWRAEGRYSGIHLRLPDSATLRGDLRIALNLEGVDIGSRGTLFVCAEHTRLHADECVHALERAIDGLREDRLID
jgi:glutamate-1-semialdehyde 2,1-aminomutase